MSKAASEFRLEPKTVGAKPASIGKAPPPLDLTSSSVVRRLRHACANAGEWISARQAEPAASPGSPVATITAPEQVAVGKEFGVSERCRRGTGGEVELTYDPARLNYLTGDKSGSRTVKEARAVVAWNCASRHCTETRYSPGFGQKRGVQG